MIAVDGRGTVLGALVASASEAEVKLARPTLETIRVNQKRGRPRTRPVRVTADRAYDSRELRSYLRGRGRPTVVGKEQYALRNGVERAFAHLDNYKRLLIRYERHVDVYRAFFLFTVALLTIKRLLK